MATLVDGPEDAGYTSVAWHGTDDGGRRVTSGVYFYKLETDRFTQTEEDDVAEVTAVMRRRRAAAHSTAAPEGPRIEDPGPFVM